jgi:hypothetical protein
MSQAFVVAVLRDGWSWPKLSIVIEGRFKTAAAADRWITRKLREMYEKRRGRRWSRWSSMRVVDFRVVDRAGLVRLQAAAKASKTIRRKRAAQKAAKTRARNLAARRPTFQQTMLAESKSDFYGAN